MTKILNRLSNLAFITVLLLPIAQTQSAEFVLKRDIPYAEPAVERQVLDVYSPVNAKDVPVIFWIHGGGWQTGDKSAVQLKPQAFVDQGFVFVATNYRLLPNVEMGTINRDIAKSIHWVTLQNTVAIQSGYSLWGIQQEPNWRH